MKSSYYLIRSLLFIILITLPLFGFGCKGGDKKAQEQSAKKITLNWWRTEGKLDDFRDIIKDYKVAHPNVSINLRVINPNELEQTAIEALASGKGPDIISLPNSSLGSWLERLTPLPPSLTMPFMEMKGFIQKQPTYSLKTTPTINLKQLQDTFVDVVRNDVVWDSKIYGLPLSFDSLLLYYNREMLNVAEVPEPPATWNDFKEVVRRITKLDKQSRLVQNGAAIGEADNIPYVFDIISALMLQNSTRMTGPQGTPAMFNQIIRDGNDEFTPGADALMFYTDFANPAKEVYSWNRTEPGAWSSFAAGKTAMVFGYWGDRAAITAMAPKINIGIAPLPQVSGGRPLNYANYSVESVTKQSAETTLAWDFVQFITKRENATKYLTAVKKPTAHRALVTTQLQDIDLNAPAKQILTAKSWYYGKNRRVVDGIFKNMVQQVLAGTPIEYALQFAVQKVNQTLQVKK